MSDDDDLRNFQIYDGNNQRNFEQPQSTSFIADMSQMEDNYYNNDNYRPDNIISRHRYTTSIHRNSSSKSGRTTARGLENQRRWMTYAEQDRNIQMEVEDHASQIVGHMEKDEALMEDTPASEELRKIALRDMPQNLTIKRCVKSKLKTSVSQKSKHKPISIFKKWKYSICISWEKFKVEVRNLTYTFELWYSTIKSIEGHFGSSIASYFKFLKYFFLMNCFIIIPTIAFIVAPQLYITLIKSDQQSETVENGTDFNVSGDRYFTETVENCTDSNVSTIFTGDFSVSTIFTGDGYFTDTVMYYGHYTDESIDIPGNLQYNIPLAYFFTMLALYIFMFVLFSMSMAGSYRRSFIETKGGIKNVFARKIFCGWDYQIATKESAELKCAFIFQELKEILRSLNSSKKKMTCLEQFQTRVMQVIVNLFIIFILAGVGLLMFELLKGSAVIRAVAVNLIIMILPMVFTFIIKYEDYKSTTRTLMITLGRIFLLQVIIIGVIIGYHLIPSEQQDWETKLGQEIYRLIVFDFIFYVIFEALLVIGRLLIHKYISSRVDPPDFDIARNVLHIIYNQTLLWLGFFFSPLLPVIVAIKLWLTWYIRSILILHVCKPTSKKWRASNAHFLFFSMSFISLALVLAILGYIIVEVKSNCGPFSGYITKYVMELLTQDGDFWKIIAFITKPGVVAMVLIALGVMVYYQYEKSRAHRDMVTLLRGMLVWQAKDKEFLLQHISKITHGKWQYRLQDGRAHAFNPVTMVPIPQTIQSEDDVESDDLSSSGDLFLDTKKYN